MSESFFLGPFLWSRKTIHVSLKIDAVGRSPIHYEPGDHVGVFATNDQQIVDGLPQRLANVPADHTPLQLQVFTTNPGWKNLSLIPFSFIVIDYFPCLISHSKPIKI